eukprot:CAMPEP_0168612004 /NCGR_PEP_ID=MMETSP0449_2-20121227/2671_1 /TAXON_ID=1082188 /ORGANISM="Strombidium rassoulzadegani, Strain ras09" /LENGTH=62 /DNA_ID=CAMNT_0008652511 /DNA_START=371 /DNA_END=559 /DNA_ORIENTATION=+
MRRGGDDIGGDMDMPLEKRQRREETGGSFRKNDNESCWQNGGGDHEGDKNSHGNSQENNTGW